MGRRRITATAAAALAGAAVLAVVLMAGAGPLRSERPRQGSAPLRALPEHCVRVTAGSAGTELSADGTVIVHLLRWRFLDEAGGRHGFEYLAWGEHSVSYGAGRRLGQWRGFSHQPIEWVEFCGLGPEPAQAVVT